MIKTGIDIDLKPLEWNKKGNKKGYTGVEIIRALNVQLGPEVYSYYQIERQSNTGICYLSVVVENNGDEEEYYLGINSMDMGELMQLAEKDRVNNISSLIYRKVTQLEVIEDMMPPLNWKDIELTTTSGLKSCMYAKILSLSKYGELYFLISQDATGKYHLELKCRLDLEYAVKEVVYTHDDLQMVLDFAKRYRLYQVAKSLTGG